MGIKETIAAGTLGILLSVVLPSETASAQWERWHTIDESTKQSTLFAGIRTLRGASKRSSITIRCAHEKLDVIVGVGKYLGAAGDAGLTQYRFDKGAIKAERWAPGDRGTFLYAKYPYQFIEDLLPSNVLAFEARDFQGTPHRVVFETTGATKVVAPVAAACPRRPGSD